MIIIGHRGARGLAPENTLASFDKALEHGVAYVEFDVRLTKDKQLVVIHDRHTKRVAADRRQVRRLTLAELQTLAAKNGTQVPTLDEVLTHLHRRVRLNIEIKSHGCAKYLVRTIWHLLDHGYDYGDFFVSSFYPSELSALRELDEHVQLALLHRRTPFGFLFVPKSLRLFGVGFRYNITWPWSVALAKKRGLFTYSYNVNNLRSARLFESWGVDAMCTDRPDVFAAAELKSRAKQGRDVGRNLQTLESARARN